MEGGVEFEHLKKILSVAYFLSFVSALPLKLIFDVKTGKLSNICFMF